MRRHDRHEPHDDNSLLFAATVAVRVVAVARRVDERFDTAAVPLIRVGEVDDDLGQGAEASPRSGSASVPARNRLAAAAEV